MKILTLRFKNLNSLQGEWKIDFTRSPFSEQSLFAITGPTGAGKTTLLDAICLALYHQTPRLGAITHNNNEIMTRGMSECLAEVEFEIQGVAYRAFWAMRRAGNKATGNFQPAKVELAEVATGKILASKVRDKLEQTEKLTGLNFARFTQSILLSQGEFAAFLKAKEGERAELLEQLTGTEIYGQVSIAVHKKLTHAKQRLEVLKNKVSSFNLLTQEELAALTAEQQDLLNHQKLLDIEIKQQRKQLHWYEQEKKLQTNLQQAEQQLTTAQEALSTAATELAKLAAHQPAEILLPSWKQLHTSRKKLEQQQLKLEQEKEQLPSLEVQEKQLITEVEQAKEELQQAKNFRAEQQQLINEVIRPLDYKIQAVTETLKNLTAEVEQGKNQQETSTKKLAAHTQDLQQVEKQLSLCNDYLTNNAADSALAQYLGIWQTQYKSWQKEQLSFDEIFASEKKHQANLQSYQAEELAAQQHQQKKLQAFNQAADKHSQAVQQQEAAQKQGTLEFFDAQLNEIQSLWPSLERAIHQQQTYFKQQQAREALEEELPRLAQAHQQLTEEDAELRKRYLIQKQLYQTLTKLIDRESQLAELRTQLKSNEACPLCGSFEHQIEGFLELPATVKQKEQAYAELEQIETKGKRVKNELDRCAANLDTQNKQLAELKEEQKNLTEEWQKLAEALPLEQENSAIAVANLDALYQQENQRQQVLQKERQQLQEALTQVQITQTELNEAQIKLATAENKTNLLKQKTADQQEHLAQLTKQRKDLQLALTDDYQRLLAEIKEAGFLPANEDLSNWLASKEQDSRTYQHQLEQQRALAAELTQLETEISHAEQNLAKEQLALETKEKQLIQEQAELTQLEEERIAVFGTQEIKPHLKQLAAQETTCEQLMQKVQQKLEAAKQAVSNQQSLVKALKEQEQEQINETSDLETDWQQRLIASEFADQAAFEAALLSPEEKRHLQELEQKITDNLKQAETVFTERQKQLHTHLQHPEAATWQLINADAVQELLIANEKTNAENLERLGQFAEQFNRHQAEAKNQQTAINELETYQVLFADIQQLHHLIGSSDGQKFRKFAQGLTLDHLIYLANKRLNHFYGRYCLERRTSDSLNFSVLDTWQGDYKRDVSTLSGGESFLVSLALALALSDLVSNRTRIDSLFLDEGFGTLDAETLDFALDALDSLNATGKTIGIISHIEAIRERLPVQLKVHMNSGLGISQLDKEFHFIPTK